MRVRVKGLVFVGFAAAVFAQSAFADNAADMKTVTSKYYVDQTFQTLGNKATSITTDQDGNSSSTTAYPTVSAVTGYAEALANKQTTIAAADNGDDTHYPTVNAVYDFVTSQVSGASGDYQPVVQSTDALQIGYKPTSGTATWKTLQGASSGNGAATNYVTIKEGVDVNEDPTGVYTVNLDASQIADSIATDGSARLATENAVYDLVARETVSNTTTINLTNASANSGNELVPTVRNVYDYVEGRMTDAAGAYQPKVGTTVSDYGKLRLGSTARSGEEGSFTYSASWSELQASQTGPAASNNYVTMTESGGVYTINLGADQVGTADTDVVDSGTKLLTGNAVYDYVGGVMTNKTVAATETSGTVTASNGFTTASNTAFPTVANVKQYVTEQLAALPMNAAANNLPAGCQDGTHYCALVAHAATSGGTITYEWTVMAPVPAGE